MAAHDHVKDIGKTGQLSSIGSGKCKSLLLTSK